MIPVNLELVNELWLPNIFIYNLKTFKVGDSWLWWCWWRRHHEALSNDDDDDNGDDCVDDVVDDEHLVSVSFQSSPFTTSRLSRLTWLPDAPLPLPLSILKNPIYLGSSIDTHYKWLNPDISMLICKSKIDHDRNTDCASEHWHWQPILSQSLGAIYCSIDSGAQLHQKSYYWKVTYDRGFIHEFNWVA